MSMPDKVQILEALFKTYMEILVDLHLPTEDIQREKENKKKGWRRRFYDSFPGWPARFTLIFALIHTVVAIIVVCTIFLM